MGPRRSMAILHIGVIKTGSTAIQGWLQENRDALEDAGLRYVSAFGRRDHRSLADALRAAAASGGGLEADGLRPLLDAFAAEVQALPAHVQTLIVSSEHLSGLRDGALRLLREAMARHVEAQRVIVYLRRQDEFAVSRYSNMLRAGRAPASPMAVPPPRYDELLARWAGVFGTAALSPRIYAAGRLVGDDAVTDFRAAAGIVAPPYAAPARRANPNLDPAATRLLHRLNLEMSRLGLPPAEAARRRHRVAECLQAIAPGQGELPSRQDAEAYLARCAAANEAVRQAWFPELDSLFPTDLSRYPQAPPPQPTKNDVLALALRCLMELSARAPPA